MLRKSVLTKFASDHVAEEDMSNKSEILEKWNNTDDETKAKYRKLNVKRPDPAISLYQQDNFFGVISERLEKLINFHCKTHEIREKGKFKSMIYKKSMMSLVSPGEPVGEYYWKYFVFICL